MELKGFNQNDYVNELLDYCKRYIPEWQDKTGADILAIAQELGINLEDHYQTDGWKLGLSPNRYFNPDEYRLDWQVKHPGDTLEGIDLYQHYLDTGAAQNINPSNSFDESDYINNVLNYYKQHYPAEWGAITYDSLKAVMASAGITALSFHTDYNIDESIFPVFAVPAGEAVHNSATQTIPIDVGTITDRELFDASSGSFKFIENPDSANNVEITAFSSDDIIEVIKGSKTDYFFTNDGEDVIVSLNTNEGIVSIIKLTGILEGKGDVILAGGYEDFNAIVGFEAFTFA